MLLEAGHDQASFPCVRAWVIARKIPDRGSLRRVREKIQRITHEESPGWVAYVYFRTVEEQKQLERSAKKPSKDNGKVPKPAARSLTSLEKMQSLFRDFYSCHNRHPYVAELEELVRSLAHLDDDDDNEQQCRFCCRPAYPGAGHMPDCVWTRAGHIESLTEPLAKTEVLRRFHGTKKKTPGVVAMALEGLPLPAFVRRLILETGKDSPHGSQCFWVWVLINESALSLPREEWLSVGKSIKDKILQQTEHWEPYVCFCPENSLNHFKFFTGEEEASP